MSFVELVQLTKKFGDFTAVDDLSLHIEKGEFISLLGPSGCGKTTTLQMIAGLQQPDGGQIKLDGEDITHKAPNRRGLGIVFQSYALFPHMTVAGNVSFGLEMRNVSKETRNDKIRAALSQVRLEDFAERHPRELSGGQRQRVALARALVIEPPVLLLDEPLSNLDAKLREEMQIELRTLQQQVGVTTILVTHDQSEALSMSDRVVVMNSGRVEQIDTPVGVYDSPLNNFVSDFVGKTNLFSAVVNSIDNEQALIEIHGIIVGLPVTNLSVGDTVQVFLRPERIRLDASAADGIDAIVDAAIFHGDRWLFQIKCALGKIIATAPNAGEEIFRHGQSVKLSWPDDALRILTRSQNL
ncbi:MAG: ABC transporter ATP-binding protein [Gammaproteobacteria bacterium]|nr:ABC transporter ATP-binding protein [Gammaproteobacteria bacterium]